MMDGGRVLSVVLLWVCVWVWVLRLQRVLSVSVVGERWVHRTPWYARLLVVLLRLLLRLLRLLLLSLLQVQM